MRAIKGFIADEKARLSNVVEDEDGFEIIQAIFLILIAVILGGLMITLGKGLYDKAENQINTELGDNFGA